MIAAQHALRCYWRSRPLVLRPERQRARSSSCCWLLVGALAVASRAAGVPPTLAGCCARAASIAAPRLADAPAWALRGRPEGGKLWWLTYTP